MNMPRAFPAAIRMTDAAAERVRQLVAASGEEEAGLRLGIKKGGCAGMSYTMNLASRPEPGDDVVETGGARVFVDPSAMLFLLGTEMDYKVDKLSAGFVFNNPNQVSACGCGESVELRPAERP